ncbi:MAG: metallopeptidase family protein [Synoicihabitans sp.]
MTFEALKSLADEEIVATRDDLPEDLRELADRIPVISHYRPNQELLEGDCETDILGLFVGPPHGEDSGDTNDLPAQIFLFLGNLWEFSEADENAFLDEVRITYLHELGHYFGWDENDLTARGLD